MHSKRLKTAMIIAVSVICIGVIFVVLWAGIRRKQRESSSARIQAEISEYSKQQDKDGLITETPDPYFIEKQKGYRYRRPDTITYHSEVTNTTRHAMVFLPADYSAEKQYPVLYLLHGYGGSHKTWRNKKADIILQNLYYFEDVPEMIVVCQNCNVNQQENVDDLGMEDSTAAFDGSAEDLVTSLMPYIEVHYPIKTGAENTAIAGNSMGGRNAIYAAYTYPDRFGYVGAFSSGPVVEAANGSDWMPCLMQELPTDAKPFNLLMIVTGKTDEICGKYSYQLDDYMNKLGIEHIFYDTTGGHQTVVWQNALYNFAKKLFINQ